MGLIVGTVHMPKETQKLQAGPSEVLKLTAYSGLSQAVLAKSAMILDLPLVKAVAASRRITAPAAARELIREYFNGPEVDLNDLGIAALRHQLAGFSRETTASGRRKEFAKIKGYSTDAVRAWEAKGANVLWEHLLSAAVLNDTQSLDDWKLYHPQGQFEAISDKARYWVGPSRQFVRGEHERLMQAKIDSCTSWSFVVDDTAGNISIKDVGVHLGGHYDKVVTSKTADGSRRYGVLLDQELMKGDVTRVAYSLQFDRDRPSNHLPLMAMKCQPKIELVSVEVAFDPRALPAQVWQTIGRSDGWPDRAGSERIAVHLGANLSASCSASTSEKDYAVGLHWEWP